jgi:gluconate 2-dehydrogenase gamma chain
LAWASLLRSLYDRTRPTRRRFLGGAIGVGAAVACARRPEPTRAAPPADAAAPPQAKQGQAIPLAAWRALDALTARILPSEGGPGAREAHVVEFLDRQLASRYFAPLAPAVLAVARLCDDWSQRRFGRVLADLEPYQQDEIVGALANGEIPAQGLPQRELFQLVHTLTLEGFLGDPVHGGNADEVGWRAIGFATPHLRTPGAGGHSHLGK